MIPGIRPYSVVKDSGDPWLGFIPEHWDLRSLGSLTSPISLRGRPDLPLLSVVRERGVVPRSLMSDEENHNFVPDDLSNYKVVRAGNLVINKMKAWQGSLGIAPIDGIVSPAYFVFDFKIGNRRFGQALLRSKTYVGFFARASDGVRIGQWDLSVYDMKRIPAIVPPPPEQSAIVRFLDYADRHIQRYIRTKKKLIALLNEQKQAIIHRAVIRGLEPNVQMKPSGVEWLGEVPKHWEVRPAKYFYREVDERSVSGAEELLSVSHLTGVTPRSQKTITMFMASSYVGHKLCRPGDLVINTMWAWMAALGVAKQTGIVSPAYGVYRPLSASKLTGNYADLLLRTRPFVSEYVCRSTGIQSSRLRLYPEQFLSINLVCPPPEEQQSILSHVSAETVSVDRTIFGAQQEIDLLREYRTRLIADVVTGKLDVREAAARLPDEAEELSNESETLAMDDEEAVDLDAGPEEAEA
jgi:type I restriction enzyme S subunit